MTGVSHHTVRAPFKSPGRVLGGMTPQTQCDDHSSTVCGLRACPRGPRSTVCLGLTSMRKSPIRSPARHATPPSSTDSRYCSAGKAGVGVNSSMGVCAADGEEPAGSERRGWRGRAGDGAQTQVTEDSLELRDQHPRVGQWVGLRVCV